MPVMIRILQIILKIIVGFLFTLGIICLVQSFALFTTKQVDGNAIGIFIMGFEIGRPVLLKDVPWYAFRFLWAGLLFMLVPVIYYAVVKLKRRAGKESDTNM